MQSPDLVKTNVILDPKKHYLSFVNFKAQSKKNYIKKSQSKALQMVGLVVYRQVCTKNSYSLVCPACQKHQSLKLFNERVRIIQKN